MNRIEKSIKGARDFDNKRSLINRINNLWILFPDIGQLHTQERIDPTSFLVMMEYGIGDVLLVGIPAIEGIIDHRSDARGKIDVVCNAVQAQLFECDPRIRQIIVTPQRSIRPIADGDIIESLREKRYAGVFPGEPNYMALRQIEAPIMKPGISLQVKFLQSLIGDENVPMRSLMRAIVDRFFGIKSSTFPQPELPTLYVPVKYLKAAKQYMQEIRRSFPKESKLLLVNSDSSSVVTRPPTSLLADGIGEALELDPTICVCMLPSYTDETASQRILDELSQYRVRTILIPPDPKPHLLFLTAFIGQSDIFLTPDTGLMHLAVAKKRLIAPDQQEQLILDNKTKIISIFGGTNSGVFGYKDKTMIIGLGRREQNILLNILFSGLIKDVSHSGLKNFFDHIDPDELTEAILN